jgi:tetratricopeptide (TPR) repeat protein
MKRFTLAFALLVMGTMIITPNAEARSLSQAQQLILAQTQSESSKKEPELKPNFGQLKQTESGNTRSTNKVQTLLDRAAKRFDSGDLQGAIQDSNQVLKMDPKNAGAYYVRGISFFRLQNYKQAVADSTKLIGLNPNNYYAYYLRGASYFYQGNKKAAIADYQKTISLAKKAGDNKFAQLAQQELQQLRKA